MFQTFGREGRINTAFKPVPGVGIYLQSTTGICDLNWIPIGTFDEHVHRIFGTSSVDAAHNARNALRTIVV